MILRQVFSDPVREGLVCEEVVGAGESDVDALEPVGLRVVEEVPVPAVAEAEDGFVEWHQVHGHAVDEPAADGSAFRLLVTGLPYPGLRSTSVFRRAMSWRLLTSRGVRSAGGRRRSG